MSKIFIGVLVGILAEPLDGGSYSSQDRPTYYHYMTPSPRLRTPKRGDVRGGVVPAVRPSTALRMVPC